MSRDENGEHSLCGGGASIRPEPDASDLQVDETDRPYNLQSTQHWGKKTRPLNVKISPEMTAEIELYGHGGGKEQL